MWELEITESQGYSVTLRIPIIDILVVNTLGVYLGSQSLEFLQVNSLQLESNAR